MNNSTCAHGCETDALMDRFHWGLPEAADRVPDTV